MGNITKNHKAGIFAIFIASALMLGTISVSGFDSAYAGESKDKDKEHDSKYRESNSYKSNKNNGNEAEQEIEQQQFSSQDSQCISGNTTLLSCNNVAVQLNNNTGNQALGQE